jgi:uncharacterized Fe-S cluster protein YjdI
VPAHANRDTARRVVPLFRPYRAQVTAVVGLIVLTSTIGIINPLLIQQVSNKALFVRGGPNIHLLVILVAIMAVVPIVNGAIGILQTYQTTRVGQQVTRDLRDRLYAHLQTLSLAFFTWTRTGEIQSRLANDVGGAQTVVTTTASSILANVVTFTSTVVAMVILSWQLTIVALITVPVFFWLTKAVGERRRQVTRSTQESLAAMSALSEETLSVSGVLLAKAFGNQARDTTRYHQENQRLADLEVRQQMIGQGFYAIVQSVLSITPAAVYLIAGLLLMHGTAVSAGTVVAFTTLQTRLYFPIGQLLQVSVELRSSLALFDRIFEYLDVVPDIADAPDAVDLQVTSGTRPASARSRRPSTPSWGHGPPLPSPIASPPSSAPTSSTSSTPGRWSNPVPTATCWAKMACTPRCTRSSSRAARSNGSAPAATSWPTAPSGTKKHSPRSPAGADRRRNWPGDLAWGGKMSERASGLPPDEPDEAPEGFREQPRYAPTVERAYTNDRIEVTWEPAFCIHAAECLRGLPAVFDNHRRPWIIVDNGSPGDIGEVIQRCPTGALPPPGRRAARAGAGGDRDTGTPERPVVRPRQRHDLRSGPHAGQAGHPGGAVPVRIGQQAVLRRQPSQGWFPDRMSDLARATGWPASRAVARDKPGDNRWASRDNGRRGGGQGRCRP